MSNPYHVIKNLTETGKLRIVHIDAPPRSISSAFQIALTEGGQGHLYEPFRARSRKPSAVEDVAGDVLNLYSNQRREEASSNALNNKPVTIVVKELSQYMKDEDFKLWLPVLSGWVTMMRTPNTQAQSFMTRSILNGKHFSEDDIAAARDSLQSQNGAAPSDYEVVTALSESFRVKPGSHAPADTIMPHKLETPAFDMWGALSRHHNAIKKSDIPHAVVDGTVLCTDGAQVMKSVAKKLGMSFNPSMVTGWEIAGGSNLISSMPPEALKKDAWITDAVTSRGLELPKNQPLPLRMFTPTVGRFVSKALEFFQDFANDPNAILPRTPDEIQRLFSMPTLQGAPFGTNCKPSKDRTFETTQPIIAYAIALSMRPDCDLDRRWRGNKLQEIRATHYKLHEDSFQIMEARQRLIDAARGRQARTLAS